MPSPSASWWYRPARIQSMMENRSNLSSELESEIEASRVHWSQLDLTSQTEHAEETNRKYFQKLKLRERKKVVKKNEALYLGDLPGLFREMDHLVVGNKIAEGAQAEIYEARFGGDQHMVKVFNADFPLHDLEKQWPLGILKAFHKPHLFRSGSVRSMQGATLLKDERFLDRFAFVMDRCCIDLRKSIDQQMIQFHNQGPPFTPKHVWRLMYDIAYDITICMGKTRLSCRGLKAANVLVEGSTCPLLHKSGLYHVAVADLFKLVMSRWDLQRGTAG